MRTHTIRVGADSTSSTEPAFGHDVAQLVGRERVGMLDLAARLSEEGGRHLSNERTSGETSSSWCCDPGAQS